MGSPSSAVPRLQFTPAGVVVPSTADVLTGVQSDINSAFGGGVNPDLRTPQGQLASSETAAITDANSQIAYISNAVDPQYADGRWQDAIARIYYLYRNAATSTVVLCNVVGAPGAVIPAGSLAQDTSGNTYACVGNFTIPPTGNGNTEFQNIVSGPIACAANTLVRVFQAVPGWDAIDNVADGVLGSDVESRREFETRRTASVAKNAQAINGAVYGEVFDVPNVLDVYVIDNPTGASVNYGPTNYPIPAHCLYVAAVGGLDADIANAILRKKNPGCDMAGNTSVVTYDQVNYTYPYPAYTINFERPAPLDILFAVSIVNSPSLPFNVVDLVKAAIIATFNGLGNLPRERIGGIVFASNYYAPVSIAAPNTAILSILVGTTTATLNDVAIGIDQYPSISAANIAVTLV